MVIFRQSVQTCVVFRKLQDMTLFALYQEDWNRQSAPVDTLKRAVESCVMRKKRIIYEEG
jgi:undecaprenyl pyrophosphate synthase